MEPLVDDAIAHIGTFLSLTDLVAFRQTHPRIRRVCTALYDQHTQRRKNAEATMSRRLCRGNIMYSHDVYRPEFVVTLGLTRLVKDNYQKISVCFMVRRAWDRFTDTINRLLGIGGTFRRFESLYHLSEVIGKPSYQRDPWSGLFRVSYQLTWPSGYAPLTESIVTGVIKRLRLTEEELQRATPPHWFVGGENDDEYGVKATVVHGQVIEQ